MKRTVLVVGAVLTFGCGTPIQLLLHNELPADAKISVRWSEGDQVKPETQEATAFVPKGRAEEVFVWRGTPDDRGVDFLHESGKIEGRVHVPTAHLPPYAYHVYVRTDGVRFAKHDWMDEIHLNMTSYMAPCYWVCILATLIPAGVAVRRAWQRQRTSS